MKEETASGWTSSLHAHLTPLRIFILQPNHTYSVDWDVWVFFLFFPVLVCSTGCINWEYRKMQLLSVARVQTEWCCLSSGDLEDAPVNDSINLTVVLLPCLLRASVTVISSTLPP